MRIKLLIAMIAVAALFAFGTTADALYVAHQETNTVADSGDCSACHIPHKAPAAKRGFPLSPSAGAQTTYGYVGAFCLERCHLNVTGTTGDAGNLSWANTASTVAAATFGGGASGDTAGSHGMNLVAGHTPSSTTVPNTLPYGNGTSTKAFECTTCHNVHDNASGDASNALLMLDIDALCDECHTARGAGDGAWGALYGSGNTVGSHPVGTDVNNDEGGAASPIRVGIGSTYADTAFDQPYGAATMHNLGGHLINGAAGTDASSPITCSTCHAVHGVEADAGDANPTGGTTGTEDLLVIAQGAASGTTEPNRHANGAGDANNALCEGCHVTNDGTTNIAGWNPGGTAFSHPADAMADADAFTAGTQAVPDFGNIAATNIAGSTAEWPFGSATAVANIGMGTNGAAGTQVRVICESCHTPHPAANNGATGYSGVPASGTPILRRANATLCGVCHNASNPRHHPIGAGLMAGLFDDDAISATATADADLTCSDCHNGANMAHNWTVANFPTLDADWEPAGNGLAADANNNRYQANTSKECNDCHFGGTARYSPTAYNASATDIDGNTYYDDLGDGSHFLGTINAAFGWASGYYNSAAFNASTTVWPESGGWSRFAGTASPGIFVCESCHELQPTKNVASTPLLLGFFDEGNTLVTGEGTERYASEFCEGCHGRSPGGNITHPMTLDTVTKANDAGLSPVTLITTGTRSGAASPVPTYAGAGPGDSNYPAANAMNCDSCHQVHDAATTSGTYILDALAAKVVSAAPRSAATTLYTANDYTRSLVTDVNYELFCTMCHAY